MTQTPEASARMSRSRDRGQLRRVVGASLVGTTIEWYDFFIYASAAGLVFGKQFFPRWTPPPRSWRRSRPSG